MMDFLKSFLEPGTIVGVIGAAIGVWGLWFGYKGRRTQLLEYQISSAQIITNRTNNIPGLKIAVGDEFASDLISSKIEFFNRGNTTIMQKDFASTARLQIVSSGHFFNIDTINKELVVSDNINLNPEINVLDNKTLSISFEYLKPKQYFSMTVLHDGEISITGDLVAGKIRPLQDSVIEENTSARKNIFYSFKPSTFFASILISILVCIVVMFISTGISAFLRFSSEIENRDDYLFHQIKTLSDQNEELEDTVLSLQKAIADLLDANRLPASSGP